MPQRIQRYVIPATVVLMSFIFTVYFGISNSELQEILEKIAALQETTILSTVIALIIALGVTNFGLGFICHVIYWGFLLLFPKYRLPNKQALEAAFKNTFKGETFGDKLGGFHFRLHSCSPKSFLEFCTRRNTGLFIAGGSSIAVIIGWIFGVIIIKKNNFQINCCNLIVELMSYLLFATLCLWVAYRMNAEFSDAVLAWLNSSKGCKSGSGAAAVPKNEEEAV